MSGIGGLAVSVGAKAIAGRMVANAKRDIAAIPPKVKLAIAGALIVMALFFVHQHVAHKRLKAADAAGYARAKAEDAAAMKKAHDEAAAARARQEQVGATITNEVRTRHDQEDRNIAVRARDVGLRGAGAARCGPLDYSDLSAGAGRSQQAGRSGDVAVGQLPPGEGVELIGLPVPGTVAFAEQHDTLRNEVLTWREWYDRQFKAWERFRSNGEKAPAGASSSPAGAGG
jgi:hypothetical protein